MRNTALLFFISMIASGTLGHAGDWTQVQLLKFHPDGDEKNIGPWSTDASFSPDGRIFAFSGGTGEVDRPGFFVPLPKLVISSQV